jgi:glycosyltransferase involved in cell wall biosynthesis
MNALDWPSREQSRQPEPIKTMLVAQPTIGGAAVQVWQLATSLDKSRYAVTVVSPDDGWLRKKALGAGVSHRSLALTRELRPLQDLRAFLALWSVVRREKPHLIHAHSSKAGFLARVVGFLCRVPAVLYTPHGFAFNQATGVQRWLYLWLERLSAPFADRIICVSQSERQIALRDRVAPPEKLVVIRNGVDVPVDPNAGRGVLRAILGVGEEVRIVAMVSRLRRPKQPEDLVQAAAVLSRRELPGSFRCVIVGSGPLERRVRELTRDLGLEGEVVLLGERSDVPVLMADVDAFVLATASEGMPYTILEAMAAGKPVVASRVPGVTDLVLEGDTGYFYTPGDPCDLADRLTPLLHDEDLRRRLGERGRRRVEDDFPSRRMVGEIQDLYRRVLSQKERHPRRA